jgi:uncharacterized RDD family membrane protein YckC
MNETSRSTDHPAPLWRRLLALLYELLAVLAILFVIDMISLAITREQLDPTALWYRALLLLAVAGYFVLSWVRGGQTLGMRPWRLRLYDRGGGPVHLSRALLRFVILLAPMLLLGLAPWLGKPAAMAAPFIAWSAYLAVAAFDRRRRALHDLLSGTELRWAPPR